ncbi:MAG: hypothetical protein ABSC94_27555 [Polyangiaceae bacterium]|jgi:hypothetical protein
MSRIELTGLIGSHPLGALASFGLLRVLSQVDDHAKLSFVERDDWIAALDSKFATEQALLEFITQWGKARIPSVFAAFGEDDVRIEPTRFQALLRDALSRETESGELATFLVALAADGAEDKAKHLVKPSPFYMASGQQSFLETMRKLHGYIRKSPVWNEALFGPWSYATLEWGAGWDPATERMHALRFKAPTKDKTSCVVGAVALGFEALPLFPTFSIRGSVRTVGWVRDAKAECFRWPLPSAPMGVDALGLLVAAAEVSGSSGPGSPMREGIAAIYESARFTFGQGYAVFRPARRIA